MTNSIAGLRRSSRALPKAKKSEKKSEVTQSCLTLCDPVDCGLSGSSVHGIFQARVLEWIAISRHSSFITEEGVVGSWWSVTRAPSGSPGLPPCSLGLQPGLRE